MYRHICGISLASLISTIQREAYERIYLLLIYPLPMFSNFVWIIPYGVGPEEAS